MGALLGLISDFLIEECFEAFGFVKEGELTSYQSNRSVLAKAVSYNFSPLFRPCRVFKSLTDSQNALGITLCISRKRPEL